MIKLKKKKNPSKIIAEKAAKILKDVDDYEYLTEGSQGEIFYFINSNKIMIDNIKLLPGEYILKINKYKLEWPEIRYLKKLSDLKLIPQIYIINNFIIIMKYISGKTLSDLFHDFSFTNLTNNQIYTKINNLINKWHLSAVYHGDLNAGNILITKNNVFFIDPLISDTQAAKDSDISYREYYKKKLASSLGN